MYNFDEDVNRRLSDSMKWNVKDNELPMWVADMDFKAAPEIQEALLKRVEHGVFGYTEVPLRWYNAIIEWWKKRYNVIFKKSEMQFVTGVIPAISSMVKRLSNVGDNIVTLTPVYDIFFHSIENAGRHVLESPLKYRAFHYEIDFTDLESKLSQPTTTLMILCNPHNPIGKIFSRSDLRKIGDLCIKHNVTVISDEIHCDLVDPKERYIPFLSVSDNCANVSVTCISPSKSFNLAGLQSACVVIRNKRLRDIVIRGLNSDEVAEPNCFAIDATVAAYKKGEKWIDELRSYLYDNKKEVYTYLKKNMPDLKVVNGKATYLVWIDISKICSDADKFQEFTQKSTGLIVASGKKYRGNGNGFIRLNIACNRKILNEGLKRLNTVYNSFQLKK